MDAHYDSQIQANTHSTFSGPARQMGSGGGIGAFAVRMGRVAIPLVRKYILPVAKQVSKNLIESAVPEIGQILTGRKKPSRKLLTNVIKRTALKTVKTNLPSGITLRPGGGELKPGPRRSATASGSPDRGGRRRQRPKELHETSNYHRGIESEVIFQTFQQKPAPREVGPTFCLKFNLPSRVKFRGWHQLTICLLAIPWKLQNH